MIAVDAIGILRRRVFSYRNRIPHELSGVLPCKSSSSCDDNVLWVCY